MTITDYKWCKFCNQEKPLSEFYEYQTRCKACMAIANKIRGEQKSAKSKLSHIFGSEGMVIQQLRQRGIPAYPGKSVSYAHVDVVAWGSVGIEVKSAHERAGVYQWGFSKRQLDELQSDVIVLVTLSPVVDFYLFKSDHPVFFIDGKRKRGVSYQPDAGTPKHRDRYVMSEHDMNEARGKWSLIEDAKQAFSQQLIEGVEFPKWIRIGA